MCVLCGYCKSLLLVLWHCIKLMHAKFNRRENRTEREQEREGEREGDREREREQSRVSSAEQRGGVSSSPHVHVGIGDKYFVKWPAFCLASNAI